MFVSVSVSVSEPMTEPSPPFLLCRHFSSDMCYPISVMANVEDVIEDL